MLKLFLLAIGFLLLLWPILGAPVNRFVINPDKDDDYTVDSTWFDSVLTDGYRFDFFYLPIPIFAVVGYFVSSIYSYLIPFTFPTSSDYTNIFVLFILYSMLTITARYLSTVFSLSRSKKVRRTSFLIKHHFWLYLDTVSVIVPLLPILLRTGLQKRLIYNYIMAIDSFELYAAKLELFDGDEREKIQNRMIELIPVYKNYFKVMSTKMGTQPEIMTSLLKYLQDSGSLNVQFIPTSHNFLAASFKEWATRNKAVGKCDESVSFVAKPFFTTEGERERESLLRQIVKSTFSDVFGVSLIQLTKQEAQVKLYVDYVLLDQKTTFANKTSPSVCYVAPRMLWHIKLVNRDKTLYETQLLTTYNGTIKNVKDTGDFYNKIAMTHYVNLSKELLSGFGISIAAATDISSSQIEQVETSREDLLDFIMDNVTEYGEDFLESVSEEFYANHETLISAAFMASSALLAIKHQDYEDLAVGALEGSFDFALDGFEWSA